jgi:hypothetical protein
MDTLDLISHIAAAEAKGYRRGISREADVDARVPYFCIKRSASGARYARYEVAGHNAAGHDNEPRMDFVCDFLRTHVLPYVDPLVDVSGFFNIELHDSYSYLPDHEEYRDCLTFSRRKKDSHMTVIPNPYQMGNYGNGQFNNLASDDVPWDKKSDTLFFAGSTTGSRDPLKNERIRACCWALQHPGATNFKISGVVQMSADEFTSKVPQARDIVCDPVPLKANFAHKYLVNIAGNTCAWSRVPMVMASKSLLMHMYHGDMEWFYPLMIEGTHFVGCATHTLLSKHKFARENAQLTQFIIANANKFCSAFLGRNQAALYMTALLESIAAAQQK